MLETAVGDSSKKLSLQEEVSEAGRMYTNVAALGFVRASSADCEITFLCCAVGGCAGRRSGRFGSLKFLIRVVDEIFFGCHDDGSERRAVCVRREWKAVIVLREIRWSI